MKDSFLSGFREFREEIRAFVAENLPDDMRERARRGFHATKEDMRRWMEILHKKGWSAPNWPKEYGGTGWSPLKRMVFEIEMANADAPPRNPFGFHLIGPVLCEFGTEQQKARYLPAILDGSEFWCQGFSEPNAGSDLASLKTMATLEGDHYVVNGQKTWTSEAHLADMIFCLVRTNRDGASQGGISMMLIDMKSPGVTVRPIITQDLSHYVNEIFLENVKVPVENLVGEENQGWRYAKFLLENERTGSAYLPQSKSDLNRLRSLLAELRENGDSLASNPVLDAELARAEIDLAAHEMMVYRIIDGVTGIDSNAAASMIKARGAELQQRIAGLWVEALGPHALPLYEDGEEKFGIRASPGAMSQYLIRRAVSIYGGANEIQYNIIAKRGLHL